MLRLNRMTHSFQVSFAEYRLFSWALLQKRPISLLRLNRMTHSFHWQQLDVMGGENVKRHIHVGCD